MATSPRLWLLVLLALGGLSCAEAEPGADKPAHTPAADCGPTADAGTVDPPSATAQLFDDFAPTRHFQIQVAAADWKWLNDNATKEQYVPATVVYQGETHTGAAVRYKGGFGSLMSCFDASGKRTCDKLSLKLKFNEYDKKGRFHGVRKLVLNSCNRDPTCLHERLSYTLFRRAGIIAPRSVHATVQVNDEDVALHLLVEAIDDEFLEDHFDDPDGNLYKEIWPQHLHDEPYVHALRTNEDSADVSRMVAFAKLLGSVSDDDFEAKVADWIDQPALIRYFVVDQMTHNWDGIWKFYCPASGSCRNHNFYFYDDPSSGRLVLIPWDLDHTFNYPNGDMARSWWEEGAEVCKPQPTTSFANTLAPQCDPLLRGVVLGGWDEYVQQLASLTADDGALGLPAQRALLDRYRAMILDAVAADKLGPGQAAWSKATAQLRSLLAAQQAEAKSLLAWTPG